ncbi:unnamed protein product [Protopolystoma xenopodis]|uniref:Uncharacterized protein n=1 Tax=Protopolystoma xenopodis TaxID=117903 RepID=A0A448X661_9PLAT|nr:unnamed protein product [Protopolystoma xenopodis]
MSNMLRSWTGTTTALHGRMGLNEPLRPLRDESVSDIWTFNCFISVGFDFSATASPAYIFFSYGHENASKLALKPVVCT